MIEICTSCKTQGGGFDSSVEPDLGELTFFCRKCGAENTREVIEDLASIVRDAHIVDCDDGPGAA